MALESIYKSNDNSTSFSSCFWRMFTNRIHQTYFFLFHYSDENSYAQKYTNSLHREEIYWIDFLEALHEDLFSIFWWADSTDTVDAD